MFLNNKPITDKAIADTHFIKGAGNQTKHYVKVQNNTGEVVETEVFTKCQLFNKQLHWATGHLITDTEILKTRTTIGTSTCILKHFVTKQNKVIEVYTHRQLKVRGITPIKSQSNLNISEELTTQAPVAIDLSIANAPKEQSDEVHAANLAIDVSSSINQQAHQNDSALNEQTWICFLPTELEAMQTLANFATNNCVNKKRTYENSANSVILSSTSNSQEQDNENKQPKKLLKTNPILTANGFFSGRVQQDDNQTRTDKLSPPEFNKNG